MILFRRVPLLVTEIFDAGFLGEGILQTILDAHEKILTEHAPKVRTSL